MPPRLPYYYQPLNSNSVNTQLIMSTKSTVTGSFTFNLKFTQKLLPFSV